MFLVLLLVAGVTSEPTTTKTYELEVPGADSIRIVEGEPLWSSQSEHRAFSAEQEDDPLHQFLANYAESVRKNNNKQEQEEGTSVEKPKSWDLMQYQKHNHPFDDKKGWVSLEPVPWSMSKISKWQSKYKPNPKPWDDYDYQETQTSSWSKPPNNYDMYVLHNKPNKPKPVTVYNQKVQVDYLGNNKYSHKHDNNCNHPPPHHLEDFGNGNPYDNNGGNDGGGDIITDGLPANFPHSYEANRRRGTDIYPDSHPNNGEGDWVLLSTTKGYKQPQKQRSLQINPDSIGSHRTVRLTVLPPLKNSRVNMTTSHGGLLQVESTFETVEQSRNKYKKKQKLKRKRQQIKNKPQRQQVAPPTTVTTTRQNTGPDSSAVLAAVGAGMIPATMAMLVPMAMGRRRKREVTTRSPISITLPRNLY